MPEQSQYVFGVVARVVRPQVVGIAASCGSSSSSSSSGRRVARDGTPGASEHSWFAIPGAFYICMER